MTNLNLKLQLAKQAIKTQAPATTLEELYEQHKLTPAKHQNPLTKKAFHGNNVFILELEMLLKGYNSCNWSTFVQYKNDDNSIVKGQKGTYLTLAVYNEVKDKETGKKKEELQFFKGYTVFNYEQTEKGGAKASETKQIETTLKLDPEKIEKAKESHNEVKKIFEQTTETVQKVLNLWDTCEVVA